MKFKKSISMLIVPAMIIATMGTFTGCSDNESAQQAKADSEYVQVADTLNKSYEEAKAKGYTGTYEEWVKLLELHQSNPQAAASQASSSGFDGMDMLMAGAMGMMIGNMMSNVGGGGSAYRNYQERQRSYGSSAYVPAQASRLSQARSNVTAAKAASSAKATSSSGSTARGGFGGAVSSGG